MTLKLTLLYSLFALAFSASTLAAPYPLSWLAKILPVLLLIIVTGKALVKSQLKNQQQACTLFLLALICSLAGDIFLDVARQQWFIYGLGAFMLAHCFFIASFWPLIGRYSRLMPLLLVYGLGLFTLLHPGLGKLWLPVSVYMLVLLAMAVSTRLSVQSNPWLIVGALSFIVSDSLIAIDSFIQHQPYNPLLIMLSYYLAQYCLSYGFIKSNSQANSRW
jgi:uncharacterized membrane protein YhhN